jgi:hypothetical protein
MRPDTVKASVTSFVWRLRMTKFFTRVVSYFTENVGVATMATIKELGNGQFALLDRQGFTVGTYSRARDARRGASRRGLQVA